MSAVVFCGPTVDTETARSVLPGADCRPPATQGDVHAAVRDGAGVIALIDGVFLDVPSVWHREILAALESGVAVLGAASMGALRAVECEPYGMVGVGRIVEAFRSGRYPPFEDAFEDDDEVAVVHGPAELGARALSDAMVDLRECLARAEAAGVIDAETRARVAGQLKALFFPERSFERLVDFATDGLDVDAAARLAEGLRHHRCSQKREDALELLRTLATTPPAKPEVRWQRERTLDWERFVGAAACRELTRDERTVLEALAGDPAHERAVRRRAAARLAALDRPDAGGDVTGDARAALSDFRYDRGLISREALDAWPAANGLSAAGFRRLIEDEAALDALARRLDPDRLAHAMLDELRLEGRFADLDGHRRETDG